MWQSLIETPEIIKAIYGENIPTLRNIYLAEVKIVNGKDIQCYLLFDLKEMPEKQPEKWIAANVNTAQIDLLLASSEILFLEISGSNESRTSGKECNRR